MLTSPDVGLRLALREDLDQIGLLLLDLGGPLFHERFPGNTVGNFCAWKYYCNPLGDAAVGIAVARERVVSIAAAVPKFIQVGSKTLLAFELGDFITAPEYRKRGLFSGLIQMISDEAAKRDAHFVYVRPNSSSFRILSGHLSFRELQKIDERRFIKPSAALERKTKVPASIWRGLGADRIARALFFPRASREVDVEPIVEFGAEVDYWWASIAANFSFALARTRDYLNWRYVQCPTPYESFVARRNGRFSGYVTMLVLQTQPIGYILDLVTDPKDRETAGHLLRYALNAMLARGVRTTFTWTLQGDSRSVCAKFLKRACPFASRPPLHVAVRFLQGQDEKVALPADGWQLNLGDFDGV
jgi:GNAT superfamily N-acetyltransferase